MSMVGIFGTSGMAREVGDVAWALGLEPLYVAQSAAERDDWNYSGLVILEEEVYKYSQLLFVIGIGENTIRRKVAERFSGQLRFTNLIHPSATFGRDQLEKLKCCQGVVVAAGVRFTSNIEIGNHTIFNQNVTVAHDCTVQDYVHVAPGVNISGNVHVGESCWIGAGAVINQGTNDKKLFINRGTIIGSGAVVVRDCDPYAVYTGMPAKRIK
ncbi:hypothetical protein BTW10_17660 [Chromohalobacter japonicus]|uniref:PglD N-terminal domain-containing protein n=1 Tax=Chromohalobacter japonicus TaxID=223900 RepID=A0A1Q8T877_9GAMM|nr:NeuD/PglB/VioB family sugar acetyltransferase [Chromohalobacter japonicus]OLO09870.1 hypothetical protein BTW10_17660 [Chromohalobacter japonicus]